MSLDPQLLEILVCPNDRGDLDYREDESVLVCTTCGYRYPIRDDIPVMLIDEAEKPDKPRSLPRNLTAAAGDDRPRRRRGHHTDRPRRHAGGHHRDAPARADRVRGRERGARDAAGRRRHLHRVRRDGRIGDRGRRLAHAGSRPPHRSGRRQPGAGAPGLLRSPHARDLFVVLGEHGRDAGCVRRCARARMPDRGDHLRRRTRDPGLRRRAGHRLRARRLRAPGGLRPDRVRHASARSARWDCCRRPSPKWRKRPTNSSA